MSDSREIKINFPAHLKEGAYANSIGVLFTREEFVLDFIMAAPPAGTVSARVITTPGHLKRFAKAIEEQIARYEKSHGTIETATEPLRNGEYNA